jgi:hypothetical protein
MISEYSTRRQVNMMLLFVLADLRCASKRETIAHIVNNQFFDVQPEDWAPYPKAETREPRWHTLIAWARKSCLVEGHLMDVGWDSWAISRSGIEELRSVQSRYAKGGLKAKSCYMWTPQFKKRMQPGYEPSPTDSKRPIDVYRDIQPSTLDRLLAEYSLC